MKPISLPGTVLYHHIRGYYAWRDELCAAHPRLVIENCSSGGLRFDLGILAHTHTTWLSDRVAPLPSLQLAYGATLEFTPQVCTHWMVGDAEDGTVDRQRSVVMVYRLGRSEPQQKFRLRGLEAAQSYRLSQESSLQHYRFTQRSQAGSGRLWALLVWDQL